VNSVRIKAWTEMTDEEWSDMFRKAKTVDEVFDVVDNGYDPEVWEKRSGPE
jgi:hypothetical protein